MTRVNNIDQDLAAVQIAAFPFVHESAAYKVLLPCFGDIDAEILGPGEIAPECGDVFPLMPLSAMALARGEVDAETAVWEVDGSGWAYTRSEGGWPLIG